MTHSVGDWDRKQTSGSSDSTPFSVLKASYNVLGFVLFVLNQPLVENVFASTQRSFQWELRFASQDCPLPQAQQPRVTEALAAGTLQLLAGATLVFQAYAWRLRHAIAASFFPAQEARRLSHLQGRLQRRHDRPNCPSRQTGLHPQHLRTQRTRAEDKGFGVTGTSVTWPSSASV